MRKSSTSVWLTLLGSEAEIPIVLFFEMPRNRPAQCAVRIAGLAVGAAVIVYAAEATALGAYPGAVAVAWIVVVDETAIGLVYVAEVIVGVLPLTV